MNVTRIMDFQELAPKEEAIAEKSSEVSLF